VAVPSPPPPPHKVDSFDDSDARRKQYQNVSTLHEKTIPMDSDPKNTQITKDTPSAPFGEPDSVPEEEKACQFK